MESLGAIIFLTGYYQLLSNESLSIITKDIYIIMIILMQAVSSRQLFFITQYLVIFYLL